MNATDTPLIQQSGNWIPSAPYPDAAPADGHVATMRFAATGTSSSLLLFGRGTGTVGFNAPTVRNLTVLTPA